DASARGMTNSNPVEQARRAAGSGRGGSVLRTVRRTGPMKAWMMTLAALLGLSAATARADEPVAVSPVTSTGTANCGSSTSPYGGASCGSCKTSRCCGSCKHISGSDVLGWLCYRPCTMKCKECYSLPRPAPLFAYFMDHPCLEGAPACG